MPRSKASGSTRSSPRTGEARTKALSALQLRMSGATLSQVAERVGYASSSGAWAAITNLLDSTVAENVAEYRSFHLARLERLLLGVWKAATDGDDKASQQALRILVEIGKVTGVAAPIKVEASGPGGGPIQAQVLSFMPAEDWMEKYVTAWEEVRAAHALSVGQS
jgi:hypothetical protein